MLDHIFMRLVALYQIIFLQIEIKVGASYTINRNR
jgi:hypothetical protein